MIPFSEKNGKRKWMANVKKDPVKHKKYKEKTWNLEIGWQRKQNKQMPKCQLLNQMLKILLLQATQFQIVYHHFLANKHSIAVLQGLIYISQKAQTKKVKLYKSLRQNMN